MSEPSKSVSSRSTPGHLPVAQVWEQPELSKFWQVLPLTCDVTSRKLLSLSRPQCPSLSNVQLEFPPPRRSLGSKGITVRKGLY